MMPEYVTCSNCNRVVEAGHVNIRGRCVDCAGSRAADKDEDEKDDDEKDDDEKD